MRAAGDYTRAQLLAWKSSFISIKRNWAGFGPGAARARRCNRSVFYHHWWLGLGLVLVDGGGDSDGVGVEDLFKREATVAG